MEKVHMRLTAPQARKLMRGGVIQLKPDALQDNAHYLILEKKTASKVRRAQRAGKGCRICLNPQEASASGEGIGDFFKNVFGKVKEGVKFVKEKIIDTPEYQQYVRPLVRKGVDAGMQLLVPKLGPAAIPVNAAVNKFGEYSGAYGIREDFMKAKDFYNKHAKKYVAPHLRKAVQNVEKSLVTRAKKMAPQFATDIDKLHEEYGEKAITELGKRTGAFGLRKGRGLQNDYSNFLGPSHPAMRPVAAQLPAIGGWVYMYPVGNELLPVNRPTNRKGGSFKVAGAGRRGLPMGGSFMPSG